MRRKLFDLDIPFFLPVWRRVLAVTIPLLWGLFEIYSGELFWGIIFWGISGIAAFKFYTADWTAVAAMDKDE